MGLSRNMLADRLQFKSGTPAYYVILQYGTQEYRSKVSSGKHEKVLWDEKFKFDFPQSEWENLTRIKFRIMDKEFFKDNGFVGETIKKCRKRCKNLLCCLMNQEDHFVASLEIFGNSHGR
ncbi:hypothetical protein CRYUN_Cryun14cG0034200 [Craigia yunnanensis]